MFSKSVFKKLGKLWKAAIHKKQKGDPFYSESNLRFLREGMKQLDAGNGVEHELIEDENRL